MTSSIVSSSLEIDIEPLTPQAFEPFGKVVQNPKPHLSPSSALTYQSIDLPADAQVANQGTAIKYRQVTDLNNDYPSSSRSLPARPNVSLFSCHPRTLSELPSKRNDKQRDAYLALDVNIFERHPFTTQTFVPMGLSPQDAGTCYLVVVAPNKTTDNSTSVTSPPDLQRTRAFLGRGDQAVTYRAGTWHVPMVALGSSTIDFVVWQFANGVQTDDCQEVLVKPQDKGGRGLVVRVPRPEKWSSTLGAASRRRSPTSRILKL